MTDDVKEMLWDLRGENETVECARCGKKITFDEAVPEEAGEWECRPCWERCNAEEQGQLELLEKAERSK